MNILNFYSQWRSGMGKLKENKKINLIIEKIVKLLYESDMSDGEYEPIDEALNELICIIRKDLLQK